MTAIPHRFMDAPEGNPATAATPKVAVALARSAAAPPTFTAAGVTGFTAQAASKADSEQMHAAYGAYTQALIKAGAMGGGERLRPTSSATTVRISGGKTKVVNGPYAETKEQLGGYYIVEAPDIDAALSWAARCPATS